jgi:uncharacterized protein YqgV (UPF0045/DUF77 family)
VKIDYRPGHEGAMHSKVDRIEKALGQADPTT